MKEMPLDAYLNSEADELATIGLTRLQEKPQMPMDPNTTIQFTIGGRTITRDFNSFQAIRVFAVRVTPIFTNKKPALNTLKMALLLRNNVMLP
jgi:hypothetical protein